MPPGANVLKLFTVVITSIPWFCCHSRVIKQYHHRMALNSRCRSFITLAHGGKIKYHANLQWYHANLQWYHANLQ